MGRENFKPGDHLYVDFGQFFHHGIYVGDGKVIHNCEHFATWCKTGRSRCRQLERPENCVPKFLHYQQRKAFKVASKKAHRGFKGVRKNTCYVFKVTKKVFI
jgi:cell wall-associated NlpC family hydrolase